MAGEIKKAKKKKSKAKDAQVKLRAQVYLKEKAISKDVLQATEQKNKNNKNKVCLLHCSCNDILPSNCADRPMCCAMMTPQSI